MKQERPMYMLACFGSAAVVVAAALLGLLYERPRILSFDDLQQAWAIMRTKGFHCTSDRRDGLIGYSFVISREPMTWQEAGDMRRCGPMAPYWRGRVWVVVSGPAFELWTTPGDSAPRIWGKLWAFGDVELLDEIERRCGMGTR